MLTRIIFAVVLLFFGIGILSWESGLYGEYCEKTINNQEQSTAYNLAPFIFIEIRKILDENAVLITAIATGVIAYFTFILSRATIEQGRSAKAALIATVRPRIIVRRVEALFLTPPHRAVSARFEIRNVGGSEAVLIERNAILLTAHGQRGNPFPEYDAGSAINDGHRLRSGDPLPATANFRDQSLDPSEESIRSGILTLFLFGFVKYRDEAGVTREMGFGRQFYPETNRFRPISDPEVEYGDKSD